MNQDDALNTLAKMFHSADEMEGDDGLGVFIDIALWHDGCEALEALIGGEEDEKFAAGWAAAQDEIDAARYRWLRDRLRAADFDWQDSGECALVFAWPKECAVSGSCDATIDAARLKTPNAERN